MLLLGSLSLEQSVSAIKIPDYFNVGGNEERYSGTYAWGKANEPRYGNETAWIHSTPDGYNDAMSWTDDSISAAEEAKWGQMNVVQPYLVQTDSELDIPDYFNAGGNEERYLPNWSWAKADEPRYGNETAWMYSSPAGYKEPNIMSAATIASQEALWDTTTTNQPYLMQAEADIHLTNQERLYNNMAARPTYPEWDSESYISPYTQRDHAWTTADYDQYNQGGQSQYDMSNETHWVHESAVDGYKIPITADDDNQFIARRTYPEWDSESYISPYTQRDHAWTTADYDQYNQGGQSQYDMSNETHWVHESAVDGYKIPITADDAAQFAQRPSLVQQRVASRIPAMTKSSLAQVATKVQGPTGNDYNWLCDVRGEDGKPFYIGNYDEYYHCAVLGRMNTNDVLEDVAPSFAQRYALY